MRTTVTIDPDTEALLREEVRRTDRPFKEVLNQAIRTALGRRGPREVRVEPLFSKPFPPGFAGAPFNRLADEIDDEETLRELQA
jgi:hypothetical protein